MAIAPERLTTEEIVRLSKPPRPEMLALEARLRADGLFTMTHWNALFTGPPLCITEDQLREDIAVIGRALEATDAAVADATRREVHEP